MIDLLVVSSQMETVNKISALLAEKDTVYIVSAALGQEALTKAKHRLFDLAIIDEVLSDMTGLRLIEQLVAQNPFLNCAVLSGLSAEEFHEVSEGLGVLMPLPLSPAADDLKQLLDHLAKVINLPGEGRQALSFDHEDLICFAK